jgi:hypothetical protein
MGEKPDEIERRIEQQRRDAEPKIQDLKHQLADDISTVKSEAGQRVKQLGDNSQSAARNVKSSISSILDARIMDIRSNNAFMARILVGFAVGIASRMVMAEAQRSEDSRTLSDARANIRISP